ncbi:NUDIX hydrolase [Lacticaseibacillus nasuensis]|uniref:NUDIX hydrolase n=1 Tax=Lacticaseibacillus nasuensis TaxID=944671 RepID=UPI0022479176|nr:NUDIX hydrolase [Lacticaseibacillus nasuensis]MCX2454886.1 NUDIX hydrolase [Lacticaseibacillus nasuensis]
MEITRHTAAGDIQAERQLYSGHIFDIVQQTIHTPDGLTVTRDLVKHAPAVALLALTADEQVLVNREYRVGINAESFALPAGLIDPGESVEAAARRELQEETGFVAQTVTEMTAIRSSEGMTDEVVHLMLVTVDPGRRTSKHFDQDEFVTSDFVPLAEVIAAVKDGRMASAQTVSAVSYYLAFVR